MSGRAAVGTRLARLQRLEEAGRPALGFGDRLSAAVAREVSSPQPVDALRADVLALNAGPLRDRLLRAVECLNEA